MKELAALVLRDGVVDVQPLPNGPLKLLGNLEVVSGTGHTVNRVTQAFLCRCGHSANKPYCDGSHKVAGFVAEYAMAQRLGLTRFGRRQIWPRLPALRQVRYRASPVRRGQIIKRWFAGRPPLLNGFQPFEQ